MSPGSGALSLGTSTRPNQRNGRSPLAESYSQPDSGRANISTYSSQWVAEAMRSCQVGVPGTGCGAPAYRRQASRAATSASTVMPTDLCRV
ncbi:hypothetical protein D3C71_874510 [compost metagenome]